MGNCLSRVDSNDSSTPDRRPFGADESNRGGSQSPDEVIGGAASPPARRPTSPSWASHALAIRTERGRQLQAGTSKGKGKERQTPGDRSSGASPRGSIATGGSGPEPTPSSKRNSRSSRSSLGIEWISMNSSGAVLRSYATLPNPASALSPRVLLTSNPSTIAIFDAYPKAKYHFLVLPRYPFPPQSNPDSTRSIVQLNHMDDLRSLLLKPSREAREQVINALADAAREVEEMIRDEMVKEEGVEWKIDVGFHAIPSLKHVHLHVISEDRISPALKTKKHYNSFRPDLGFFISIMDVQRWIQNEDEAVLRERVDALLGSASLLASPLTCFKCDEPYHNIPKLKAHLEREFADEKKKGLERIRRTGKQRSSDEDMF